MTRRMHWQVICALTLALVVSRTGAEEKKTHDSRPAASPRCCDEVAKSGCAHCCKECPTSCDSPKSSKLVTRIHRVGDLLETLEPSSEEATLDSVTEDLADLVVRHIARKSWEETGGEGVIDSFGAGKVLIVTQTPEVQEQIAKFLKTLGDANPPQQTAYGPIPPPAPPVGEYGMPAPYYVPMPLRPARIPPPPVAMPPAGFSGAFYPVAPPACMPPASDVGVERVPPPCPVAPAPMQHAAALAGDKEKVCRLDITVTDHTAGEGRLLETKCTKVAVQAPIGKPAKISVPGKDGKTQTYLEVCVKEVSDAPALQPVALPAPPLPASTPPTLCPPAVATEMLPMPQPVPPPVVSCAAIELNDSHAWKICAKRQGDKCVLHMEGNADGSRATCESMTFKPADKAGTLKLTTSHDQIHIVGPSFEAYADRLTGSGTEWEMAGHVVFQNKKAGTIEMSKVERIHITLHEEKPAAK
jgi:hypothetical protein